MGALKASLSIHRPCIPLVLALIVGLLLGSLLPPPYVWIFSWGLPLLLILLALVILTLPALSFYIACLFFLLTGLSLMTYLSPRVLTPEVPSFLLNDKPQHLSGEILQDPLYYPDRTRLIIQLKTVTEYHRERPAQGLILLGVKKVIK
jgi:hypothetical protein